MKKINLISKNITQYIHWLTIYIVFHFLMKWKYV